MSPEQRRGIPARKSNDIYCVGLTIFECLTRSRIQERKPQSITSRSKKLKIRLNWKMIPKSYENSLLVLIKSCLVKASNRPSSVQVILLGSRFSYLKCLKILFELYVLIILIICTNIL